MNAKETKEFVTTMVTNVLTDVSVLAPHVARDFAEKVVAKLLAAEYLICGGQIRSIIEVDYKGEDASGEPEDYTVYTPLDDEEED